MPPRTHTSSDPVRIAAILTACVVADKREFLRISQAVGMGFLIMGVIGYVVKLSTSVQSKEREREEIECKECFTDAMV